MTSSPDTASLPGVPTLADQAARDRIVSDLGSTLFVEAGAGSGKTRSLVQRTVALVASRDVEMRQIAAITFTEKAAAELRHRIRDALEERLRDDSTTDLERRRFGQALDQVDAAAISTLHAFAQRILSEHPIEAGLPPNVEVLDEVGSQIEFEARWRRFREELLDAPELERCLLLAFASGIRLDDLRSVAAAFDNNWDLVADDSRFPWPREDSPRCDADGFVDRIKALLERRAECSNPDDKLVAYLTDEIEPFLEQLRNAPDEYEALRLLCAEKPTFKCTYGRKGDWDHKQSVKDELYGIGDDIRAHAGDIAHGALRRICHELRDFTLEAANARRSRGELEFHDLLVMARELLRGEHGIEVRAALRDRYRRLLLDEFQDTDPIQIELAVLIASSDPDAGDKHWSDIETEDGRLFFVGDPKQSIYRFRRADIELFLEARRAFDEPLSLTTNFRTSPSVLAWVNHVFERLINFEEGSQPEYQGLAPSPWRADAPEGAAVTLLGVEIHDDDDLNADDLREREASDVADAILTALTWQVSEQRPDGPESWRPAELGDITILLPARTSLAALEAALDERDIPYRAETSSLVYTTREVRDLLMTVRALVDPTDALALVSALRSPVFGCGDDDLFEYKVLHRGAWHIHVDPPEDLDPDHPVVESMRYLRGLAEELPWLAPSEVLDRIARDRRLFELGYAEGRPRDLWRRLRFVIDQARAWSESEGGTLRQYLEWARLQASDSARVAETVLPETDDDSVRIMTMHGAKGLEFPITILSGMTTEARRRYQRVEVKFPSEEPVALKVGKDVTMPEFEDFQPVDEQMDAHERLRLLYVACTRAKDHLVVSLHRQDRNPGKRITNAELIAGAFEDAPHQEPLEAVGSDPRAERHADVDESLLPFEEWERERATALEASARRRTIAATHLRASTSEAELDEDTADGIEKQPRDLELPPWQKGRYGTAIGRAVHAVLQTIDLGTGEGLDEAAAAQAAAEGVVGHEQDIARLARAALDSPTVQEAVRHEHWRETYVATTIDGLVLEGYIDLLYRTDEGLVIVDYKTASPSADLDRRMEDYRSQAEAYAQAARAATGEEIARVVFVFLTSAGPEDRELTGATA